MQPTEKGVSPDDFDATSLINLVLTIRGLKLNYIGLLPQIFVVLSRGWLVLCRQEHLSQVRHGRPASIPGFCRILSTLCSK